MPLNPNVPQGVLNRVRGSLQISQNQDLNVTAPYLGSEGMSFNPTGNAVDYIRTLTGMVRSPAPYMGMEGTIHLLRTQSLSNLWKNTLESDAYLGQLTLRPDASQLGAFVFQNCSIAGMEPLKVNGTDAGFMVRVEGVYPTNGSLYNNA